MVGAFGFNFLLLLPLLMLGPLVLLSFTTPYYLAVTDRRIILIMAKMGAFHAEMVNRGTEEIRIDNIEKISRGGLGANRSLTFDFADGSERRCLRISPYYTGL